MLNSMNQRPVVVKHKSWIDAIGKRDCPGLTAFQQKCNLTETREVRLECTRPRIGNESRYLAPGFY